MSALIDEYLDEALTWAADGYHMVLLVSLLVICVLATAHVLSLVATRWGDQKIMGKSLIGSILLHSVLIHAYWVVWQIRESVARPVSGAAAADDDKTEFEQQISILDPQDDAQPDLDSGESPFWQQPIEQPVEPDRIAAVERQRLPENIIRDQYEEAPENQIEASFTPAIPRERPDPEEAIEPASTQIAETPLQLPDEVPFDQQVRVPGADRERVKMNRQGVEEQLADPEFKRGGVDRIADSLDPDSDLRHLMADRDPAAETPEGTVGDEFDQRTGPVESKLPDEGAGGLFGSNEGEFATGSSTPNAFERIQRRVERVEATGPATTVQRESKVGPAFREDVRIPLNPGIGPSVPGLDGPGPEALTPEAVATVNRRSGAAPAYAGRDLANRLENAIKRGGSEASEKAVRDSLRWLARVQEPAGNWDASRYGSGQIKYDENNVDRMHAGIESDTGITALALLCFLGSGHTHEKGDYTRTVQRALDYLMNQQAADGNLFGRATHFARMYCHGMASYALAEAYGMQENPNSNPRLRIALQRAISFTIQRQNSTDGGWRYRENQQGDMSMFGWQFMALKSAEIAGLNVPIDVSQRMAGFLKSRSLGTHGGLAAYRPGEDVSLAMTAEALFCKQMMGLARDDKASVEAIQYLTRRLPHRGDYNLYYWYYGMLSMYHYGGQPWMEWNSRLRDMLVRDQVTTGPEAGSWRNSTRWGAYGGRIYSTALSTLCLEVYYRQLPLYRSSRPDLESTQPSGE